MYPATMSRDRRPILEIATHLNNGCCDSEPSLLSQSRMQRLHHCETLSQSEAPASNCMDIALMFAAHTLTLLQMSRLASERAACAAVSLSDFICSHTVALVSSLFPY